MNAKKRAQLRLREELKLAEGDDDVETVEFLAKDILWDYMTDESQLTAQVLAQRLSLMLIATRRLQLRYSEAISRLLPPEAVE